jgi:hypothetical protein
VKLTSELPRKHSPRAAATQRPDLETTSLVTSPTDCTRCILFRGAAFDKRSLRDVALVHIAEIEATRVDWRPVATEHTAQPCASRACGLMSTTIGRPPTRPTSHTCISSSASSTPTPQRSRTCAVYTCAVFLTGTSADSYPPDPTPTTPPHNFVLPPSARLTSASRCSGHPTLADAASSAAVAVRGDRRLHSLEMPTRHSRASHDPAFALPDTLHSRL